MRDALGPLLEAQKTLESGKLLMPSFDHLVNVKLQQIVGELSAMIGKSDQAKAVLSMLPKRSANLVKTCSEEFCTKLATKWRCTLGRNVSEKEENQLTLWKLGAVLDPFQKRLLGQSFEDYRPLFMSVTDNTTLSQRKTNLCYHYILVLDWDVHHGNGTQHAFYDDPRVLYLSIHRYDNGTYFPCLPEGDFGAVGEGAGQGFNINVAWNQEGMSDGDYLTAFFQLVLPVAYAYNPELVLVSCGFDSCVGDPLGYCRVTAEAYAQLTHLLLPLARGRVILALEGGYNLSKLPSAVCHCVSALLGQRPPQLRSSAPCPSAVQSIRRTLGAHRSYWPCLRYSGYDLPSEEWLASNGLVPDGEPSLNMAGLSLEDDNEEAPFCIQPETWCPHLESLPPLPPAGLCDPRSPCMTCGVRREVWTCLHCFKVFCSRYVNGHMVTHHDETQHPLVLSYSDLSVWCYGCNFYITNPVLQAAKEDAYLKKFGTIEFVA
ncbi:hypothetical protein HPB49_019331 [Dermacentor silvarum]|uniref:Uncharacterized protein n=1 Tax=Dermacentor silvarum TaxID=543639 RepID=A0ACB8CST2_DERSI|nr:hypothetical protein HPB49_019331 [Dermacentor silvarum]